MKQKRYPRKFQRMAVERMRNCEDVSELAQELGVTRRCLYKWRAKLDLLETGEESARPSTHEESYRKQVQRLKRLLAEKTLEVDFFKRAILGPTNAQGVQYLRLGSLKEAICFSAGAC